MQWVYNNFGADDLIELKSPFTLDFAKKKVDKKILKNSPFIAKYHFKMEDYLKAFKEYGELAKIDQ
jgi:hypothetical protein